MIIHIHYGVSIAYDTLCHTWTAFLHHEQPNQDRLTAVQLSKESIISASLDILDSYGLADMTMRRLATHLGVAPGALYWHFKNKQALIDAIARHIMAPLIDASPSAYHHDIPSLAFDVRSLMLRHRDGAELLSAALTDASLRNDIISVVSAILGGCDKAYVGASTLLNFILGSCLIEQSEVQRLEIESGTTTAVRNHDQLFMSSLEIIIAGLKSQGFS